MTISHPFPRLAAWMIAVPLLFATLARAQDAPPETGSAAPNRWLLLCCGLPGDSDHRERLTEACRNIIAGAQPVLNIPPEQIKILAGDKEMQEALAGDAGNIGICNRESVADSLRELSENVPPDAGCWILMLGHAHLYGSSSQFNVLGPDFDQDEFAGWAKPINCREQVFWLTMPISGFWTKSLVAERRVIVSATEADLEFTGTEMPYALGDLFVGEGEHQELEDVDQDGSISLLDLYLAVSLEIHERFQAIERLQTEHAQLEDNGDGRASEVQQPYIPVEEEEPSEDDEPADDEPADKERSSDEEAAEDEATEIEESVEDAGATESSEPAKVRQELPKPISNPVLDGFRSRHIPIRKPA